MLSSIRKLAAHPSRRAFSSSSVPTVQNLINGQFTDSASDRLIPLHNPATGEHLCNVPESTPEEMEAAVAAASEAFKTWKEVPIQQRMRVYLKYQGLIREHTEEVAKLITQEQGKTLADARGDVFRGLEVVEHCASLPSLSMGETQGNLAANVDTYSYRVPLGVTAGICPFNFPAMIPLWMFPVATTLGNTSVMKPSERDPGAMMRLAELAMEAGLPDGVLNIIHGAHDSVNFICDNPDIKAISFVGGDAAGTHIFNRGGANGKRVQSNMGAKNHGVILPDADRESVVNQMVGSAFGAAGQRCMALSQAVFVGDSADWIHDIAEKAAELKVGPGWEDDTDVGPMISPGNLSRAKQLIADAEAAGATILLDGRDPTVPGYDGGNWLGPTILTNCGPGNPGYENEIFGPVLTVNTVDTLDEAIALVNANKYGNGTCIFTNSGSAARKYQHEIEAGQVGINVPIPVPLPFFSFTGNKGSIRGDINFYGKGGMQFYTQWKTITSSWRYNEESYRMQTSMPTLG